MNEEKVLFDILRIALAKTDKERVPAFDYGAVDYELLYQMAIKHTVTGMLSCLPNNLLDGFPEEILDDIALCSCNLVQKASSTNEFIAGMGRTFNANGIRYALLKGQSCAAHYPTPTCRAIGDVDVYVVPEHFQKALDIMLSRGFVHVEDTMLHATMKHPQGWMVELHRALQKMQWPGHDKALHRLTRELFDNADPANDTFITLDGQQVRVLPFELEILMMTIHTLSHVFCAGIGLRHICDWAARLGSERLTEQVIGTLKPMFNATGTEQMWNTLAFIINSNMGKMVPYIATEKPYIYNKVMRWMMESGNFSAGEDISFTAFYWRFLRHCVKFRQLSPLEASAWPMMKGWRAITDSAHRKIED